MTVIMLFLKIISSLQAIQKSFTFTDTVKLLSANSLTLGAHAQRGLLYLVCVSVCVSVCVCVCLHLFSPYRDQAGSSAIPTAHIRVQI